MPALDDDLAPQRVPRRRRNFLLLTLLVVLAAVFFLRQDDGRPKRIILITIDTLRADHLSAYGYERTTAPNLDRLLGDEGILFQRSYASSPWTLPSVASVLTSLHPPQHGLTGEQASLSPKIPTLASTLRDAGWTTVAFVGHIYVGSQFGLDQGFDEIYELYPKPDDPKEYIDAGGMMTGVESWLTHRSDEPLFLYLHLFDPHFDYAPPAPFDREFTDPDSQGSADGSWRFVGPYKESDQGVESCQKPYG